MSSAAPTTVRLQLEGMSCASCAARIERTLSNLEGVDATVNFATEQATVRCAAAVPVETLVAAVEEAGYGARPAAEAHERGHVHENEPLRVLKRRLALAVSLSVPVALLAMVSRLQFAGWAWVALALSTPVVFHAGAGFHRAAAKSARHRTATMDTRGKRLRRSSVCKLRGTTWRWSATVSTTRRRWPRQTSGLPWAPARTSRSKPPT